LSFLVISMASTVYDYAIIGAGAAGLHLALAMLDDPFFISKKILILEKQEKNTNDRTWCFWESGKGKWDTIITHNWTKGDFFSPDEKIQLDMGAYQYKMLRGLDFYKHSKSKIEAAPNFFWKKEEAISITSGSPVVITGQNDNFSALQVFDSRIEPDFFLKKDKYSRVLQHFKGWWIETEEDVFDPENFTMMDYRLQWKDSASFFYVLPVSKKSALIEFTLFTPELIPEDGYTEMLKSYFDEILKPGKYTIKEEEQGIIPMSDYPFHKVNSRKITKIGTAGSWVKPSTGYSFKNSERFAQKVISNLKQHKNPSAGLISNKFRYYDTLFLHILYHKNYLGEGLFRTMYQKNPAWMIFRFLDEETSFGEDLKIMASFNPQPFMQAIAKTLTK
jgi:lycopene beta-cyclase